MANYIINPNEVVGMLIPTVYISRITLEKAGFIQSNFQDNPHIDPSPGGKTMSVRTATEGVIDRAFEYDIPSGLVNCNDSIDYTVTFTDDDIVDVNIYDIQVFSSMDGYDVQCMNQRWSGWTQWEEPTSVPYQIVRTPKIKYICN